MEEDYRGDFVVIEGLDGSGTTTQRDLICEWLDENYEVVSTQEPTKEEDRIGEIIRKQLVQKDFDYSPESISLAFAADRKIHLDDRVIPALEEGKKVVSDRYYHSSFVYQPIDGVDESWVREINREAIEPDVTIMVDVPADECIERISRRDGESSVEFEILDFQRKVRKKYLELANELDENIYIVDGTQDIEEVNKDIKEVIENELL